MDVAKILRRDLQFSVDEVGVAGGGNVEVCAGTKFGVYGFECWRGAKWEEMDVAGDVAARSGTDTQAGFLLKVLVLHLTTL